MKIRGLILKFSFQKICGVCVLLASSCTLDSAPRLPEANRGQQGGIEYRDVDEAQFGQDLEGGEIGPEDKQNESLDSQDGIKTTDIKSTDIKSTDIKTTDSNTESGTTSTSKIGGQGTSPNQCRRASAGGLSRGFSLTQSAKEELAPPAVVIRLSKTTDGKQTTSSCTGYLSNLRTGLGTIVNGKLISSEMRMILLPRITLAKHCMLTNLNAKISKIRFAMVDAVNQVVEYDVGETGATFYPGTKNPGPWFLDLAAVKRRDQDDSCTAAVKSNSKPAQIACFTSKSDQFVIISNLEHRARKFGATNSGFLGLEDESIKKASRLGVIAVSGTSPGSSTPLNWGEIFASARARAVAPLNYDFDLALPPEQFAASSFVPKSKKEAYDLLALRLQKLSVVSSVVRQNDKPITTLMPVNGRWESVIEIFGQSATTYSNSRQVSYFKIEAIGLQPQFTKLTKGHSGTLLLGHWLQVSRPLLSLTSYRQMMGVLSTVAGEDVCVGDDLTCCEKIR
jgi:hypothetical protein